MIFSPTTLTRSNAVKRHQKFKFPIDEFLLIKTVCSRQKKTKKQYSKFHFFHFFAFCDATTAFEKSVRDN